LKAKPNLQGFQNLEGFYAIRKYFESDTIAKKAIASRD